MSAPGRPPSPPVLPALDRAVGSPGFELSRTSPLDDDRPFTIAGAAACIRGGCRRGVDSVVAAGLPLLRDLRVEGCAPVSATLTPLGLERTLRVSGGMLTERAVVASADPVCFLEWVAAADLALTLTWSLPGPGHRWTLLDRGLLVEGEGGRGLYALSDPSQISVSAADEPSPGPAGPRVTARVQLAAGQAVRVALGGAAPGADEGRLLRVMGRPQVVVPARRAESLKRMETGLSLECPEVGLAEALEWAKAGLAAAASPCGPGGATGERALRVALAGLAVGETGAARRMVVAPSPLAADPGEDGLRLLLVSRYLAWTGDIATLRAEWPRVRQSADRCLERVAGRAAAGAGAGSTGPCARGLAELRVAAEEVGDGELAGRLASWAGGLEGSRPDADVGAGADPDADPDEDADEVLRSVALVEAVVRGVLGVEPDAPRGRLTLRPRLGSSWGECRMRSLRVGDAVVEMSYRREGSMHRFVLRQSRGGAPLRVILEPELGGDRLEWARVDGEAAELDARLVDGRLRVPVQLVLDHERRVELEIGGAAH